jgi:hypothetical protein
LTDRSIAPLTLSVLLSATGVTAASSDVGLSWEVNVLDSKCGSLMASSR